MKPDLSVNPHDGRNEFWKKSCVRTLITETLVWRTVEIFHQAQPQLVQQTQMSVYDAATLELSFKSRVKVLWRGLLPLHWRYLATWGRQSTIIEETLPKDLVKEKEECLLCSSVTCDKRTSSRHPSNPDRPDDCKTLVSGCLYFFFLKNELNHQK